MSVSGPPARRLPGLATQATGPVRPAWPADDGSHLRHSAPAARKRVLPRWDDQPEDSCDKYILPHAFAECKDVRQAKPHAPPQQPRLFSLVLWRLGLGDRLIVLAGEVQGSGNAWRAIPLAEGIAHDPID